MTHDQTLDMCALGLGEAGEVQDKVKKYLYHGHVLDVQAIAKELGDVLWYTAVMADLLGFDLSDIAELNLKKLEDRYGKKFTEEASINRKEEKVDAH